MSWIKTIEYEEAEPKLKRIYDRVKGPNNSIDNVLSIHSLRPHTLTGHMTLYKSVLHNSNNQLPKWYLESIGVYVSYLNQCNYCVQHHYSGLKRLLNNSEKTNRFFEAVTKGKIEDYFKGKELKGIEYSRKLTEDHASITKADIEILRIAGFSDGEILEINQVACYFNYVNRMVVGLGVNLHGDILGLSPGDSDDPKNWTHQ